jgi:SCY1-like protein 1
MALAATTDIFNEVDCANRIMPAICPLLIDKEKVVRDQASKTFDLYLAKVRKSALSMADTVLPPPSAVESSASAAPRMSTPQPSEAASWAGWAISSFTNKISAAAGEIQSTTNGGRLTPEVRSNSAPQPGDLRRSDPTTTSVSALYRQAIVLPPGTSARTSSSSNANEYFQDPLETEVDELDGWGDLGGDTFFDAPSEKQKPKTITISPAIPFDDNGEPDFAGWLAAQAGKKPGAKPLPKGLAKQISSSSATTSNGRPGQIKTTTTGSVSPGAGTKKATVMAVKPKSVVVKKIDTTPKDTGDDDGWGDGW